MGEITESREITEAGKYRLYQLLGSFHRNVSAKTSLVFV